MRGRHLPIAIALLLDAIGAGGALLISLRTWQTVTTPRPAPLHDDVLALSGRTVDAAPTALALVALAGVVAVLATRGVVRRAIGGVLTLAGVLLAWRAGTSWSAISTARARTLVSDRHATVDVSRAVPHVITHPLWPALTIGCALLVAACGAWVAWRGHTWSVLSARYESEAQRAADPTKAAATLWSALDRGEDPTD